MTPPPSLLHSTTPFGESWTSSQLVGLGWSANTIRRATRDGALVRLRRGVYAATGTGGNPPVPLTEAHRTLVQASAEWMGEGVVLSHLSAAVLWGIPLWELEPGTQVWVTRSNTTRGYVRGPIHANNCPLTPHEVTAVDGLPVTTLARTVLDLARRFGPDQGVVAADWALRHAGLDPRELQDVLGLQARRPGVRAARTSVELASRLAESPAESVSRLRMHQLMLPRPVEQVEVWDSRGRLVGRGDFGWRDQRLIGECDGRVKYDQPRHGGRPSDAVTAERDRERRLADEGWRIVRWMVRDLHHPARFARILSSALQGRP
ncbi:type IV toxin-antitoxin system AbiEi family antitoxin domain-containing protein [Aestuariimicrobium sp. T2.26MG-19.2B]|uniref:type IV toxin-antitoxin system AbiEi family antitoxin domain-containing protein n=1 Tax=Aestuariimicrobium sp. T2.26MG-19.2B TaxID=3040679 RepID=UPI0025419362|nr:type IV toxin-antitoxin system AbiEi family antitoxin domain-containing protein [Aestuariimicrobium sp. T2.26MG-19.2B]